MIFHYLLNFILISLSYGNSLHESMNYWIENNWGINNQGQNQIIQINPVKTRQIPGIKDQDIELKNILNDLPKNRKKIKVAVLDTGIDWNHPLLQSQLNRNKQECSLFESYLNCTKEKEIKTCQNEFLTVENDLDQNGYPLDCLGWSSISGILKDSFYGNPDSRDQVNHGTHVAGIIRLVNPHIEIIPVTIVSQKPNEPLQLLSIEANNKTEISSNKSTSAINHMTKKAPLLLGDFAAYGLLYAIKQGAQVVNMSVTWPKSHDSPFFQEVLQMALNKGIIVVAASGNDNTEEVGSPCYHAGVICVGAMKNDGSISHFSNYGNSVDLIAPGIQILSLIPTYINSLRAKKKGFEYLSGSSQAAPYVSGVASILLSLGFDPLTTRLKLLQTAQPSLPPLDSLEIYRDHKVTAYPSTQKNKWIRFGKISTEKAIKYEIRPFIAPKSKGFTTVLWNGNHPEQKVTIPLETHQLKSINHIQYKCDAINSYHIIPQLKSCKLLLELSHSSLNSDLNNSDLNSKLILSFLLDPKENYHSEFYVKFMIQIDDHTSYVYQIPFRFLRSVSPNHLHSLAYQFKLPPISTKQKTRFIPFTKTYLINLGDSNHLSLNTFYEEKFHLERNIPHQDFLVIHSQLKNTSYSLYQQKENFYLEKKLHFLNEDHMQKELDRYEPKFLFRFQINNSKNLFYLIGFHRQPKRSSEKFHQWFYIFNEEGNLINQWSVDQDFAWLPNEIHWYADQNGFPKPLWIDLGKEIDTKEKTLRDLWNPKSQNELKIRFYYLDNQNKLKTISPPKNHVWFDFFIPPLLKNEINPFVYAFSQKINLNSLRPNWPGDICLSKINLHNQQVTNEKCFTHDILPDFSSLFRGLISPHDGLYWFGTSFPKGYLVAYLFDAQDNSFKKAELTTPYFDFDVILFIKGVFSQINNLNNNNQPHNYDSKIPRGFGFFTVSNSLIQFHSSLTKIPMEANLNRFSFYKGSEFIAFHFPMIIDQQPSLLIPMGTSFNDHLRIVQAHFNFKKTIESETTVPLMLPLKLQIKPIESCKLLDNPFYFDQNQITYIDILCENNLIRWPLTTKN